MAFNDTKTTAEAFEKAKAIGATHYHTVYAGSQSRELFSIWFFKGNQPLSDDEKKKFNRKLVVDRDCFHEIAVYQKDMKSFTECSRLNSILDKHQLIKIEN